MMNGRLFQEFSNRTINLFMLWKISLPKRSSFFIHVRIFHYKIPCIFILDVGFFFFFVLQKCWTVFNIVAYNFNFYLTLQHRWQFCWKIWNIPKFTPKLNNVFSKNRQKKKCMMVKLEKPKIERILIFDKIFYEIKWINDDEKVERCWKL